MPNNVVTRSKLSMGGPLASCVSHENGLYITYTLEPYVDDIFGMLKRSETDLTKDCQIRLSSHWCNKMARKTDRDC